MPLIKKLSTFHNTFLIIELNCDKENHVNFKYMQFSKEDFLELNMCSKLLIDNLTEHLI